MFVVTIFIFSYIREDKLGSFSNLSDNLGKIAFTEYFPILKLPSALSEVHTNRPRMR